MNYLIVIVVGLALFWLMRPARAPLREKWQTRARGYASQAQDQVAAAWRKLIEAGETPTGETPATPAPALAPPAETAAAGEPLGARLQELENVFSPTTHSAAHPRELGEQPQFVEAVGLLKAPGVPLDTVLQYALGANWALASAALAALKQRPDGGRVVDEIVRHFDKLYPWPMHFALEYFVARSRGRRSVRRCWVQKTGGATMPSSRCCFATTLPRASAWAMRRCWEMPRLPPRRPRPSKRCSNASRTLTRRR